MKKKILLFLFEVFCIVIICNSYVFIILPLNFFEWTFLKASKFCHFLEGKMDLKLCSLCEKLKRTKNDL